MYGVVHVRFVPSAFVSFDLHHFVDCCLIFV